MSEGMRTVRSGDREWVLRAEDVHKRYGTTTALAGVTAEIRAGESVAIMGPSGSGKTTLLHILAGILVPDHGRVLLKGASGSQAEDLSALSDDGRSALRLRRFGFVFQQGLLVPDLTPTENVALPLLLSGVRRPEAVRRATELLSSLGLEGLEERRIGQLSGGQAQRVAIARALVHRPQLVFADEPTGSLDSHTADDVLDRLLDSGTRDGGALVVVTHDEHVASRCTSTIRLRDGRIAREKDAT